MQVKMPVYRYGFIGEGIESFGTVELDESRYEEGTYDGDTVWVIITVPLDMGFRTLLQGQIRYRLRLRDIQAPELRGEERPEGLKSRDWLRERLSQATELGVETFKEGKYGKRVIGILYADGENINDAIVEAGFAVVKHYD